MKVLKGLSTADYETHMQLEKVQIIVESGTGSACSSCKAYMVHSSYSVDRQAHL
jgi:hypothetical protein